MHGAVRWLGGVLPDIALFLYMLAIVAMGLAVPLLAGRHDQDYDPTNDSPDDPPS